MSERIHLEADMGEVGSLGILELPILGPGSANFLVILNGITLRGFDTDADFETVRNRTFVETFIDTNYQLRENDILLNSSAYATLNSIQTDDDSNVQLALDDVEVNVRTSRVIQIKINGNAEGDGGIYRIGYQVNLLISRRI